ncbi:kinase-like domain-containing protein [Chlamydoabsidia padenii]|nr:kinase-like domain-containing protein [Chlamydoabsidia padenii]
MAQELFPGWAQNKNDITINRISGALTNAVFFIDSRGKRLLLRVYGVGVDQLIDREKELAWLARLGRLHLGPRLLGIFGNGRLEEYVDSVTLTHQDIREPTISQQIAHCMARQHAIIHIYPPPTLHNPNSTLEIWKNVDKWYSLVMRLLPALKQQHPDWTPLLDAYDFDRLGKDIETSKTILSRVNSPIVFGHNDLQYGNVLKRDDTGSLVLVDFEYAGYNSRGYDLANHFVEWQYNYHGDHPAAMTEPFPTEDQQTLFIQSYINTSRNELDANDDTVEDIQKEMEAWLMGTHVGWGLWGLVQASQSQIDFDYFHYSMERLHCFREELAKWSL